MAIIYTYPTKASPAASDLVLISDAADSNKTKNATIGSIKNTIDVVDSVVAGSGISVSSATGDVTISNTGVLGSGTSGVLPLWNGTKSLTDSPIKYDGSKITIPDFIYHEGDLSSRFGFDSDDKFSIHVGDSSEERIILENDKFEVKTDSGNKISAGPNNAFLWVDDGTVGATSATALGTQVTGIDVKGYGTNQGAVRYYTADNTGYVGIEGPSSLTASDYTITLPEAEPAGGGKILATTGTQQLAWVDLPTTGVTGTGVNNNLAVWSGTNTLTTQTGLKYVQSSLENTSTGSFTAFKARSSNGTSTQGWNNELGAANFYNDNTSLLSTQIAINVPLKSGLNRAIDFYHNSNSGTGSIGGITVSSSAVSYNTGSDYRLKENVVDMTGAVDRVKQLKPKRFNFIVDPEKTVDGLIAHEAADVVPEAVSGEKDGDIYQGIDQSKLVPLLIGAIKELTERIEALEA